MGSNEKLQYVDAHVFGSYQFYLFHINSYCRFEGEIEITAVNGETALYENVIIGLNKGQGMICYIDENGTMNIMENQYRMGGR